MSTQEERVARAMCESLGKNPDDEIRTGKSKTVPLGTNGMTQVDVTYPAWQDYVEEAKKHIAAWSVLKNEP